MHCKKVCNLINYLWEDWKVSKKVKKYYESNITKNKCIGDINKTTIFPNITRGL